MVSLDDADDYGRQATADAFYDDIMAASREESKRDYDSPPANELMEENGQNLSDLLRYLNKLYGFESRGNHRAGVAHVQTMIFQQHEDIVS